MHYLYVFWQTIAIEQLLINKMYLKPNFLKNQLKIKLSIKHSNQHGYFIEIDFIYIKNGHTLNKYYNKVTNSVNRFTIYAIYFAVISVMQFICNAFFINTLTT